MRLLVVEDDAALGERLRTRLVAEGYAVDLARRHRQRHLARPAL